MHVYMCVWDGEGEREAQPVIRLNDGIPQSKCEMEGDSIFSSLDFGSFELFATYMWWFKGFLKNDFDSMQLFFMSQS